VRHRGRGGALDRGTARGPVGPLVGDAPQASHGRSPARDARSDCWPSPASTSTARPSSSRRGSMTPSTRSAATTTRTAPPNWYASCLRPRRSATSLRGLCWSPRHTRWTTTTSMAPCCATPTFPFWAATLSGIAPTLRLFGRSAPTCLTLSSGALGPLFHTAPGRARWEQVARRNLTEEIRDLNG
jgi:hypothetical protein